MANINPFDTINCACANLRAAARAVTQYYDEQLKESGLRITQFSLLAALSSGEAQTITELAEALVLDPTTLTRNLRLLEKDALVSIVPGDDQRTRLVRLTDAGAEAFAKTLPLWEMAQADMVNNLGERQLETFLAALRSAIDVTV